MLAALLWSALAAEPAPMELGKSIYAAKCQACHGENGKGDGPVAKALPKPPADFSNPDYWAKTDEAMVRGVIETGKPGTVMRGFPMTPARQDALLLYLRSLAKK